MVSRKWLAYVSLAFVLALMAHVMVLRRQKEVKDYKPPTAAELAERENRDPFVSLFRWMFSLDEPPEAFSNEATSVISGFVVFTGVVFVFLSLLNLFALLSRRSSLIRHRYHQLMIFYPITGFGLLIAGYIYFFSNPRAGLILLLVFVGLFGVLPYLNDHQALRRDFPSLFGEANNKEKSSANSAGGNSTTFGIFDDD